MFSLTDSSVLKLEGTPPTLCEFFRCVRQVEHHIHRRPSQSSVLSRIQMLIRITIEI